MLTMRFSEKVAARTLRFQADLNLMALPGMTKLMCICYDLETDTKNAADL
jgi:hypothetical protein